VFVLCPADPWNAVEEKLVVVPGSEALQFRTRAVQEHTAKAGDFGIGAERARHAAKPIENDHGAHPRAYTTRRAGLGVYALAW
jgi:hypothetical protein